MLLIVFLKKYKIRENSVLPTGGGNMFYFLSDLLLLICPKARREIIATTDITA
jgi:hypothetical protein